MKTKQSATQRPDNFEENCNCYDEGMTSPELIHISDSEPEDETSQSEKENVSLGKLQNKAKKIIEMCLPTTKLTFPYDELESLYVDLFQCVRKGVINDFIWLNLIRWLLAMKRSFEGLLDLSCDDRFNWILTDFISSFVNYKCAEFIKDQNICNAERCATEILYVFEIFFNEKISFILDTLLKVDLNPCNGKIVNPLFRKYFSTKTKYQICNVKLVLVFKKWKMFVHTKEERDKIDDIMYQYTNPDDVLPKRNTCINENEHGSSTFESTENIESTGSENLESRIYLQSEILNLERRIRAHFDSYKNFSFYFMNSLTLPPRKNGKDVSVRSLRKQKSFTSDGTQKQRNSSQDSKTTSNLRSRKQLNENKLNDSVIEIDSSSDEDSSSLSDKSNCENYNIIEVVDLLSDEEEEDAKRILKSTVNIDEPNPRVMHTSPKNVIQSSAIQSEVSSTTQDDYNSNNSSSAVHSSGDLGMQNAREDDISSTSNINDSGILSSTAAFQNMTPISNIPLNYSPDFIISQNVSNTLVDCTGNCQSFSENVNFIEMKNNNGVNTFSNCSSNEAHKLPHSNIEADSHSQYISEINKLLCPFRCKATIKEKDNTSCETSKSRESDEKSTERSQQISVLKNHINISSSLSFHSEEVQSNGGVFNTKLISKNMENSERESLNVMDTAISNESNVNLVTETNLLNNNSNNNVTDNNNTECNNENKMVSETQLTEKLISKDNPFDTLNANADLAKKSREQELKLIEKDLTEGLNQQLLNCSLQNHVANIETKEASEISELQEIESVRNLHVISSTKKTEEISESATSLENCVREISKLTCSENSITSQIRRPSFTETHSVYMQSPKKREVKRYEQLNLKFNDNSEQLNDKGSSQEQSDLYPEIAKSEFAIKNEKTITNTETSKLNCPTIFSDSELQSIPPKFRFKRRHSQNVKSENSVLKQFEDSNSLEKSDKEITPLLERIEDVISKNKSEGISDTNANSKTTLSDSIEEKENKEEGKLLNSKKIKFIDKAKSINNGHKTEGQKSKRIQETEVLPESLYIKTYSEKNTNVVSIPEPVQGTLTASKEDSTKSEEQNKCIKENTKLDLHKVTEEIAIPENAQNITRLSESNDISLTPIETLKITQENPTNITKDDEISAKRQLNTDITTEKDATYRQDPNKIDQSNERTAKSENQENSNLSSDINQIENTGMKESCKEMPEEKATSDTSVENVEIKMSSDDKLETGWPYRETYIGEKSQTTNKVKGQVSIGQSQRHEQLSKETQINKEKSVILCPSNSQVSTTCEVSEIVKELEHSSLNYGNTETEQQSGDNFAELSKNVTEKEEKILERFQEIQQSKNIELVEISQVIENSELTLDTSENLIKCEENLTNSLDEVQKITKHLTISNEKELKMNNKEEDCDAVKSDTKSTQPKECRNQQIEWMRQLGLYNVYSENCNLPNKDEGNSKKSVLAGKLSADLENKEKLIDISEKMIKEEENNSNLKGSDICESGMDNFYLLVTTAANRSTEDISLIKQEGNSCAKTGEESFKKRRKTSRKRTDSLKDKDPKLKPERNTRNSCTDNNNKEGNEALSRLALSSDISSSKISLTVDKGEYDEIELNEVSFCFLKSMLDSDEASNENEKKDRRKYKQRKISRSANLGKDTKIPDYFDNLEGKQVNPSLILPEHKTDIENNKTMILSSNIEEYSLSDSSQNLFKTNILNEEICSANVEQGNGKYFNNTGHVFRNCLNTFPNNLNYTEIYYKENYLEKSKDFSSWKSKTCSSDSPLDDPRKLVIDLESKSNKKQILVPKSRSKKPTPKVSFKETNLKCLDKAMPPKIETIFSGKDKSKNNHLMLSPTDVFHSLHLEHSQKLEPNNHDNLKFDQKKGVIIEKLTDEVDIISVEFPNDIGASNDPVCYNNSHRGFNRMNNSQVNDNFIISPHEKEFLLTNPKLIPICNTELKIEPVDDKSKSNNEFVEIEVQPDIFETTNVQITPISMEAPSWPNKVDKCETLKKKERSFRNDTKSHCKLSLFDQELKTNKKLNTKKSKRANIFKSNILLNGAKEDEKRHCLPENSQISGEISLKNSERNHDQNEATKGKKNKCNKTKKVAKQCKVEQKICVPNSSQLCADFSKSVVKIPARIMEVKTDMKKGKGSKEIVEANAKRDYLQKTLQVQSLPNVNETLRSEKIKRRKAKVTKNQKIPYEKEKGVKIEKKVNYLQQSPQEVSTQNVDEFLQKAKIPLYVNAIGLKVQRNNFEASSTLDFENINKSAEKDINSPQCEEIKEKRYPSKNEIVIKIEEKKSYIVDTYKEKPELSFEIDRREATLEGLNEPEKKDTILSKTKNVRKRKKQKKEGRKSSNRSSIQDLQILYEPMEKIFIPSENTEIEEMKKQSVETEQLIASDNISFKGLGPSSEVPEIKQNQSEEIKAQKCEPSKELPQVKCLESSIEENIESGNKRLVKSLNDQNDPFLETNLSERRGNEEGRKENSNKERIHEIQINIENNKDNKIEGASKICRKRVEKYEDEKGTGGDNKEETNKEDTIITGSLINVRLENEKINKPLENCVDINLDRQTENIFGQCFGKEDNISICSKVVKVADQSEGNISKFKSKNDIISKHSLHILSETGKITCKLENSIQNSIEEDGLPSNIDLVSHSDKVLPQLEAPFSNKEIEIEATENVRESENIYEQTEKSLQYEVDKTTFVSNESYVPNKLKQEESALEVSNKTGKITDHQQYNNPQNCEKESTSDVTSSLENLIDNGHENVSKQGDKYSHNSAVIENVKYSLEDEKISGRNEMLQQCFEPSNSDLEKAHNTDLKQKKKIDYFNSPGKLKRCYIKLKKVKNLDELIVKRKINNLKESRKSEKFNKTSKKFHCRTGGSKCDSQKDNETNTSILPFTGSLNTPNDYIKSSELKYDSEISIGANFTISNLDDSNIDEIINLINSPNDELSDIYYHVTNKPKTNYEGKKDCMISASHYEVGISINIPNSTDNLGTPDNFVNDVRDEPSQTLPTMTNIGNTNQGFKESAELNEFKNTSIESNYYSFQEESLNTSDYLCENKDNGNNANNLNIFDLNGYASEMTKEDLLTCLHDRYKENKEFNITTGETDLISQDLLKGNQVNLYHSTPKKNADDIHCLIQKDTSNDVHKNAPDSFHFELTNVREKQSEHTLNTKPSNMENNLLIAVNSNEKGLDFKDTDFKKPQQISDNLMCKDIVITEDCKSKNKIANISVSSSHSSCNEPPNKRLCLPNGLKNLQQDKSSISLVNKKIIKKNLKKTPKASYILSSKLECDSMHSTTKDPFGPFPRQTLKSVQKTKEVVHPSLNSISNSMNFYTTKEQSTFAISSSCNNMSTAPIASSLSISKQSCDNLKETDHVIPNDQSKVNNRSSQSKVKVIHLLKHQSQYPLNQSYNKIKNPNPTNSCNFQGPQKPLTVATEWDFKPLSDDDVLRHLVKQKRK